MANSAVIKVIKEASTDELTVLVIAGDISAGDASEFLGTAIDIKTAVVFLNSNGGDAAEGLLLAKAIRKLGYATAVIENYQCLSACALIWISGSKRFLSKNALVGFHAVYSSQGVSSEGNAIYGAFYGQLGLSDRAIRYLTSAPPDGFNPVTLETAPLLDVAVSPWEQTTDAGQSSPPTKVTTYAEKAESDFSAEQGVDVIGFDLPNGSFKARNQDECFSACSVKLACKAFTFDLKNGTCYLKSGGRLILQSKDAYSGARKEVNDLLKRSSITLYGRTELVGSNARNIAANNLAECVFECDEDAQCKAFSYVKKDKMCWLKFDVPTKLLARGVVSGIK